MRIGFLVTTVLLALLSVGCDHGAKESSHEVRYQLVASSDGSVYRLDVKTGAVMVINQGIMRSVSVAEETDTGKHAGGFQEGATATNPKTGERIIFKDGKWQPMVEPRKPGETIPDYLKRTGNK